MGAALALASRGIGTTWPNPGVGCIVVRGGVVLGRGWTQPGGRPHAEAMALGGIDARGATAYVTLEPCAHESARGPACADGLVAAGVARVVVAAQDPDPRTNGVGIARLRGAGIDVATGVRAGEAAASMAGFFSQQQRRRPHITLKLALSLDGSLALADGTSRWITGPCARAHAHLQRARADLMLVGSGTLRADAPKLDVRVPGLEGRTPGRAVLGRGPAPAGWQHFNSLEALCQSAAHHVLVEGGAGVAASLLRADLVDRLLIYRAPILLGGRPGIADLGLAQIAHDRWRAEPVVALGPDRLEPFTRIR
ncbi:bifunctional diaminohydroxyphosphoribosylaminopyrimidine deaminase/5-amino-6-(5-phosphoribosylamino)uracil reductase RibD [Polymorphobacter multimanifer]|nr:bifunctional diaminohydroxyphosphoribosylaminopyrimidine deaminase/5-amino-6-(5-phosphoribosylamino)uracil reductase RibD [Polymorphobacter multimanifer]